ncbi:MAG: citrate/2-methylcitrate synthase [Burkholderiaceae bacterium]
MNTWITAKQALAKLGIKPQSLYANVSRGRIRAKPDARDSRRSLYHRQDVEQVAKRRAGRQSQNTVAAETIRWGAPLLSSSITAVIDGQLFYRGQNVVALAEHAAFEQVCECLWMTKNVRFELSKRAQTSKGFELDSPVVDSSLVVLARLASQTNPCLGRSNRVLIEEATMIIHQVINAIIGEHDTSDTPVHLRLANAWSAPQAANAIRCALVLLADHELNASTFATRVAISTGAPLAAGLLAGLSTLLGPRHGGAAHAMQQLVQLSLATSAQSALQATLNSGLPLSAFGHPLYPEGDPRARALIQTFDLPLVFAELEALATDLTGERANIDFALTAVAYAHGLPPDAPFKIFATARLAGWVAHALEQNHTGKLIRPRAQYVGLAPPAEPIASL